MNKLMTKETGSKIRFETINCLICKQPTPTFELLKTPDRFNGCPGNFVLVKCQKCGLVFQNPRPVEEDIHHFYPRSWYPKSDKTSFRLSKLERAILINFYGYENLGRKNWLSKIFLLLPYAYLYRSRSIPRYKKKGQLLEVGCSTGLKLKELEKNGWQVKGIELDQEAAQIAREKHHLDVQTGSIFDFDFAAESFDAIILDMVLGNVYNPHLVLKKATKWLKSGGQLIFSDPNFDGWEFKFFKDYCYALQLPTHITFFNQQILRQLLKKDYSSLRFVFHNFDRDLVVSSQYKAKESKNPLYRLLGHNKTVRWLLIKPSIFLLAFLGKTSRFTAFAIKR